MIIQENDTINSKLSFLLYSEFKTKFIDKIINEAKINNSFKSELAF